MRAFVSERERGEGGWHVCTYKSTKHSPYIWKQRHLKFITVQMTFSAVTKKTICFVASTLYSAIFPFPKTHTTFLTCAKFWFYPVTQYSYSLRVSEYCCLMSMEVSRPIRDAVWELLHSICADVVSISFTFFTQSPSVWIYFHRQSPSVMIHISADNP